MNNEMKQVIDECYQNYERKLKLQNNWAITLSSKPLRFKTIGQQKLLTKEEFINKCKLDTEFSEKWGLKIEERELSMSEKELWYKNNNINPNEPWYPNFPTKLITITYNNETIESYE